MKTTEFNDVENNVERVESREDVAWLEARLNALQYVPGRNFSCSPYFSPSTI